MVERALSDNAVQAGPFWSGWNAVLSDILGSYAFSVHCAAERVQTLRSSSPFASRALAAGIVACEAHRDN